MTRRMLFLIVMLVICMPAQASANTGKMTVESDWGAGFQARISVTNTQDIPIESWQVTIDCDREISSLWDGELVSSSAGRHVVEAPSWAGKLAPGETVSFGFVGTPGNVDGLPVAISLGDADASPDQPVTEDDSSTDQPGTEDDLSSPDPGGSGSQASANVVFNLTGDWGSGFGGSIEIANSQPGHLEDWTLEFEFGHEITSIWNAEILSHEGDRYVIGPASWNSRIAPGAAISFGFNGAPGNVQSGPVDFALVAQGSIAPDSGDDSGTDDPGVEDPDTDDPEIVDPVTPDPGTVDPVDDDPVQPAGTGPDHGKRVVAYFAQWGIYARDYQVSDIPADKITHLNYAFLGIDGSTLTVKSVDEWADFQKTFGAENGLPAQTWDESEQNMAGNFGRLRQLKERYPHLKVMLVVGGWTLSTFLSDVAKDAASREAFTASVVKMMVEHGFDGIDIDWEYPVSGGLPQCAGDPATISFWTEKTCQRYSPDDKVNYTLLLKELRRQLDELGAQDDTRYELSIAVPAGYDKLDNLEAYEIGQVVDFVNIMTYDFHGSWDSRTNHQSPLDSNPDDWQDQLAATYFNTRAAVELYLGAGVPADKIVVGSPFYGRAWQDVSATNHGLFQDGVPQSGLVGPGNWEASIFDYWKVVELVANDGFTPWYDAVGGGATALGPTPGKAGSNMFISYESPASLRAKLQLIKDEQLGGVMFWELSGDIRDASHPDSLLGVIHNELGGN